MQTKKVSPPIPSLSLGPVSQPQQSYNPESSRIYDLQKYLETPRTPREVLPSPRPLPPTIMDAATPTQQKKKRKSLNGNYLVGRKLGKGSSGVVHMAIHKETQEIVAVKTVHKTILNNESEARLRREYAIMKHLDHPNVIKLIDILENPTEIIIVMEYASLGDLFDHIVSQRSGKLSEKESKRIFYQVALGVQYLHKNGFVHRDLKPENILMCEDGRAFIADLGFGAPWDPKTVTKAQCGSLMYAAPEIVSSKEYVGPEVDIWSLGVLLYSMVTGQHPFHGEDDEVRKGILAATYKRPEGASDQLIDLLQKILNVDRKKRYTADQILAHPWLESLPTSDSESEDLEDEEERKGKGKERQKSK